MPLTRSTLLYVLLAVTLALGAVVIYQLAGPTGSAGSDAGAATTAPATMEDPAPPSTGSSVAAKPDRDPSESLQIQIDALKADLTALSGESDDTEADAPEETPSVEETAAAWQQQLDAIDAQVAREEVDDSWASSAEATLAASFMNAAAPSISLGAVECRSSMCKMSMTADMGEEQALIKSFEDFQPWEGGQVLLNLDPETGKGSVYVARTGTYLPGFGAPEDEKQDSGG